MDTELVQNLKNSWRNTNTATVSFATCVPQSMWQTKPFEKRFTTYSWEFACLARTRLCYLKGLKTGVLEFKPNADIPDKKAIAAWDKSAVLESLANTARDILQEIENVDTPKKAGFIISLLQHERIHHGKLILYFSTSEIEIPLTFKKTWGETNFPKK